MQGCYTLGHLWSDRTHWEPDAGSMAAAALGQGRSAGDIVVRSVHARDPRTKILNPQNLSHPNRLLLLFGHFPQEKMMSQCWRSTF